jgi:integrase
VPGRLFRDITADFLADRRAYTVDPRTMRSQMRVLTAAFGDLKPAEIDTRAVMAWFGARLDAGVSRATLNRNRSALSVVLDWAIREGLRQGPNPVRATRPFREGIGRTRYLTPDELARLTLAAAPHLKLAITIMVHTGARRGELLKLRWKDIDLSVGLVTFRRETTKGWTTRHVPVSPGLAASLRAQPRRQPDEAVIQYEGRPLKSLRTAFEHARAKAGLGRDVVLHSIRHTCASFYRQRGGDLTDLQEILGHSDIELTRRYAHLSPEQIRDRARFLGPPPAKRREDEEQGS